MWLHNVAVWIDTRGRLLRQARRSGNMRSCEPGIQKQSNQVNDRLSQICYVSCEGAGALTKRANADDGYADGARKLTCMACNADLHGCWLTHMYCKWIGCKTTDGYAGKQASTSCASFRYTQLACSEGFPIPISSCIR